MSTYSKMHTFGVAGERQFVLLSAGNLATTQAVVTKIQRDIDNNIKGNLLTLHHMSDAAEYLGKINRAQQKKHRDGKEMNGFNPVATFILDRLISPDTELQDAARCCLVSMDSTMRSNASVGPPIDFLICQKNWSRLNQYRRFAEDDLCLINLRKAWHKKLKEAFKDLPSIDCEANARPVDL